MPEEWIVVASNDNYAVSSLGNVKRIKPRSDGRPGGLRIGKVLKPGRDGGGYQQVSLWRDGVATTVHIHSLVAEAFIGPRPSSGHDVNHINGVKPDNRASNLEYVTRSENQKHAVKLGIQKVGSARAGSRFNESDIVEMRLMAANGEQYRRIAQLYRTNDRHVRLICTGKKWSHAGGPLQASNRRAAGVRAA
jgi:hypothetical protein